LAPLHHGHYESVKSKIAALALEKGYLKAHFSEKKLIIDKQRNMAHIRLAFESGTRLKIGDIAIQQDILDADMVQKYLTIKSGDFYVGEELANTYSALTKSGYSIRWTSVLSLITSKIAAFRSLFI
jgi:translocation and assembly module TamA